MTTSVNPLLFVSLLPVAWCHVEYLLGNSAHLSSLSTSCPPLAPSLGWQREKQRSPGCWENTVQQDSCVISIVLATNLEHSTVQAAYRKINCIPTRLNTPGFVDYIHRKFPWLIFHNWKGKQHHIFPKGIAKLLCYLQKSWHKSCSSHKTKPMKSKIHIILT